MPAATFEFCEVTMATRQSPEDGKQRKTIQIERPQIVRGVEGEEIIVVQGKGVNIKGKLTYLAFAT